MPLLANKYQVPSWWRIALLSVQLALHRLPAEWRCLGNVDVDGGMEGERREPSGR